jgi:hypothetical protein
VNALQRQVTTMATRTSVESTLQRVQPAMTGLIDGSLSTLAPIFAVAFAMSTAGEV